MKHLKPALVLFLLSCFLGGDAAAQQWQAGVHYQRIPDSPSRPAAGTPIEVTEVFWYGCGACFQFERLIDEWERTRPADVEFNRVGIPFSAAAQMHARAFYTAEVLGVAECLHRPIFDTIHGRGQQLADVNSLARFFERTAMVDNDSFRQAWDGFGVDRRLRAGDQFVRQLRVSSTPTVVVNRRFTLTPVSAGGYAQAIEVLNHIIELERGAPNAFTERRPTVSCSEARALASAAEARAPAADEAVDAAGPSLRAILPLAGFAVLVLLVLGFLALKKQRKG